MNLLILTRYATLGASSRLRSYQYLPWFEQSNITCTVQPFFDDESLRFFYKNGYYSKISLFKAYKKRIKALIQASRFDAVWIEKEALPWLPAWFEKLLLGKKHYILDFDDAIFHNYDQHTSPLIRYFYGKRIDKLMAGAALITAGNRYLADRATAANAQHVKIIPTVIDITRYSIKTQFPSSNDPIRIVWIGSPHTVRYLNVVHKSLAILSQQFNLKLRIIAGTPIEFPGVDVEFVPWSESTEVESIKAADIGIMPLNDSPWERGKCGYKLIQYMACGLPVVTSPIGVNTEIISVGENGYLAATDQEWIDTLRQLLSDTALRQRLGQAGRQRVEQHYCIQQVAPHLISLLQNLKETL